MLKPYFWQKKYLKISFFIEKEPGNSVKSVFFFLLKLISRQHFKNFMNIWSSANSVKSIFFFLSKKNNARPTIWIQLKFWQIIANNIFVNFWLIWSKTGFLQKCRNCLELTAQLVKNYDKIIFFLSVSACTRCHRVVAFEQKKIKIFAAHPLYYNVRIDKWQLKHKVAIFSWGHPCIFRGIMSVDLKTTF